ncbi:TolC family protein [Chitinimonas lacunae]|uniref:TolC family protein n=1 Tax=Chitinimonas lacunae TaxID=1963018 RepID=A0ABV8MQV6_9NEIS
MHLRHYLLTIFWLLPSAIGADLQQAFEHAWLQQPQARAHSVREDELSARAAAAQAWSPQPPTLGLMHRNDRVDRKQGLREWEVEMAFPLWQAGERRQQQAVVTAEREAYRTAQDEHRWRFAGQVREAWWRLHLVASEALIAKRRLQESATLAEDLGRRLQAGAAARLEYNQAQMNRQSAQMAQASAESVWQRALNDWQALTQTPVPAILRGDEIASPSESLTADPLPRTDHLVPAHLDRHPALLAAGQRLALGQARLALVGVNLRESPELSLALTRERQNRLDSYAQQLTLRLKIPFGGDLRNHPRQAAARADLIEAQTALEQLRQQVLADISSAAIELRQQQAAIALASERLQLAQDNFKLQDTAYRLGHIDLATRLRAEGERFDAEQGLARARFETARAISRYNQALGVLP